MAALQPARSDSAQVVLVVPLVPMPVPLARRESRFVAYGTLRILISTPGRYRISFRVERVVVAYLRMRSVW